MNPINWDQIAPFGVSLAAIWIAIQKWLEKVSPIVEEMVKDAENRAKDGIIDKNDRKCIAMTGIGEAEKKGLIKLNFISRFLIGIVVDVIAKRLPDFKFNEGVNK